MEYKSRIPRPGECYRHFKGNQYQVLAIAKHTECGEELVIYQKIDGEGTVYARPLEMFIEKVDRTKFPDANQEYRFELIEDTVITDETEHSLIMEFLDLMSNDEKLMFLQKHRTEITDEFLATAAMSLDFAESEKNLELRYQELMHYLKTLIKYEKRF